jgi:Response regulator containing a CheY-like receiver domain and an HTH DNA-binding domain
MEQHLPPIRILIADDFKDWRRQVLLLFQERPEWQVIAEAADGTEAIQRAEELKPDLILAGHRSPKTEWNRSRAADTTTLLQLQNSLPKSEQ